MTEPLAFDITSDELDLFLQDVDACLAEIERGLLELEKEHDPDTLNAAFRAAHSLKALAGAIGHRPMAELTHDVETLFDDMRQAKVAFGPETTDALLTVVDALKALRNEVVARQPSGVDVDALRQRLQMVHDGSPAPAATAVEPQSSTSSSHDKSVRISVDKLDILMNLVGELVTGRTRLQQIEEMLFAQPNPNGAATALGEMMPQFSYVIEQLHEEVMRTRMVPIANLFRKFPRMVRDIARQTDKQATLVIEGETTEIDRAVMEVMHDPLVHLLRNAVSHGLETPAERKAVGKPAEGIIHLKATSAEGQIVIEVTDDGRGIDPNQIKQAVVVQGYLNQEEADNLTESELIDYIFLPNLSTAGAVTETSGRGVGLDVVRTNIESLSGSVFVSSEWERGTTFQVTLPLTLALVQSMLVIVHSTLFAIPVTNVNATLNMADATRSRIKGKPAIQWSDEVIPLLDLRQLFTHPSQTSQLPDSDKPRVVVVTWGKVRVGLIVDIIIGQQEIVVKSLSPLIGRVKGLSGATILGDGRIALIVDIPGLINKALGIWRP